MTAWRYEISLLLFSRVHVISFITRQQTILNTACNTSVTELHERRDPLQEVTIPKAKTTSWQ